MTPPTPPGYTRRVSSARDAEFVPFFRTATPASRVVAWILVGVPLVFLVIGFFVPKAPNRAREKSLNAVRFGETSARPAP